MNILEYQIKARKTAIYDDKDKIIYPTLGLVGEAGEVSNKVKKIIRDDNNTLTEQKKQDLLSEIGDVLWYLANLATDLNLSLNEVAEYNLKKLNKRKEENKLTGSGDTR